MIRGPPRSTRTDTLCPSTPHFGSDPRAYSSFNLVVADNRDAYWLCNRGEPDSRVVEVMPVPAGLSMLTAYDLNDPASPRDARHRAAFEAAPAPDPWAGEDRESTRLNSSH